MSGQKVPKGYKQTEVGVIPKDWDVKPLKKISPSLSVGLVINPSSYFDKDGSVPMLVGSHVDEDRINWESANRISEASNNMLGASRLSAGDLVTVRVGDPGVTAVVPPELDSCNCASMMIVRQHSSFISKWLCYVMNSVIGRSQIEHVQYGTAQKQFNISDAVNFLYPFPPIGEQKLIARALSDIDALIEGLEGTIGKKRHIKQGAMQELLTGKRRLPGFGEGKGYKQSEGGMIPEDWEAKPVGATCDFIVPGRNKPKEFKGNIPWITTPDLEDGRGVSRSKSGLFVSHKEAKNVGSKIVPSNSILMSYVGELGIVAFVDTEIVINQQLHAFIPRSEINSHFLLYALQMQKEFMLSIATITAVPYLNKDNCNSIPIPLPNTSEQEAIATILSDMDTEIATLEAKLTKTRQLKQGMMHELLTGRIRLV